MCDCHQTKLKYYSAQDVYGLSYAPLILVVLLWQPQLSNTYPLSIQESLILQTKHILFHLVLTL